MPLFIINDDITKLKVDAIVNAANETLLGGGGVDGCIHRAAGPELLKECKTLNGCPTGEAKITKGYKLPAKYVIHTVGPIWHGGNYGEEDLLKSCYNNSLRLAVENQCKTIAFPMISAGIYGYPKNRAMKVAKDTINAFLSKLEDDIDVYIVLFGKDTSEFFDIEKSLNSYIDKKMSGSLLGNLSVFGCCSLRPVRFSQILKNTFVAGALNKNLFDVPTSLTKLINKPDESFSSMVMRKINESGISEVACYRAANITKQIFSKIRCSAGEDPIESYKPTKSTAMSLALALKLSLDEAKELLNKAGYAFSKSDKTDIIVEYCITNRIYDVLRVNEILFSYGLPVLGTKWR